MKKNEFIVVVFIGILVTSGFTTIITSGTGLFADKGTTEFISKPDEPAVLHQGEVLPKKLEEFYAEDEEQKVISARIEEQRQVVLENSRREKGEPSIKIVSSYIEFEGLNDIQIKQIQALRKKSNPFVGRFIREEMVIRGKISNKAPRLDLGRAKTIIDENTSLTNILAEFEKIALYADFVGGSGVTLVEYWFDDIGNGKILSIVEQEQIFYISSPNAEPESLFE